jgi:uncharacterized membrane protein HdeD (DUF308 family)
MTASVPPTTRAVPVRRQPALRRAAWDVLGVVLVLTGVVMLADVALATRISLLFLGWTMLIGGAIGAVLAVFRIGRGGFWVAASSAAVAVLAGILFIRVPAFSLLALSLVTGALLLFAGMMRLVTSLEVPEHRGVMITSGVISIVLGLLVLNRWPESALWLLGTLLGIQFLVDGVALLVLGRLRAPARAAAHA